MEREKAPGMRGKRYKQGWNQDLTEVSAATATLPATSSPCTRMGRLQHWSLWRLFKLPKADDKPPLSFSEAHPLPSPSPKPLPTATAFSAVPGLGGFKALRARSSWATKGLGSAGTGTVVVVEVRRGAFLHPAQSPSGANTGRGNCLPIASAAVSVPSWAHNVQPSFPVPRTAGKAVAAARGGGREGEGACLETWRGRDYLLWKLFLKASRAPRVWSTPKRR